jgi:hypothetical protein
MPVSRWHAAMRRLRLLPPPRGKGRFKRYTVGRAIEREQVHEICPLGLKHGMQLVAISGVNGVLSDEDSEQVRGCAGRRVRVLALAARAKQPPLAPALMPMRAAVWRKLMTA